MADVRSLLRNERASRRINHPHASYTESGKLLCTVCALQIKTESLWESHIKSPQHALRLQQMRDKAPPSKKRKAGDSEDDTRKRVKAVPGDSFDDSGPQDIVDDEVDMLPPADASVVEDLRTDTTSQLPGHSTAQPVPVQPVSVDEDEWAAFERDLAAAPTPAVPTVSASAVISAAPLTAEDIAAQARQDQSVEKGRREAEIEAEREDAANALQDEFDEMEELEDRVRRLREKREALRKAREAEDEILPDIVDDAPKSYVAAAQDSSLGDEDEEDEEDEFDDWNFGAN
ncbi:hypothetical protein AAFC00_004230 [Neodothiora populina]|uniref:Coiled-coil domain-containing protein 16 n=1 Tax=Neodothiora populina TaxID=2781224 RepID=A0ABR3PJB3_9PEZI